jgi:hypothetical protein
VPWNEENFCLESIFREIGSIIEIYIRAKSLCCAKLDRTKLALELAEELDHLPSLAIALLHNAAPYILRRAAGEAQESAEH